MKKLSVLIILLLISISAYSQEEPENQTAEITTLSKTLTFHVFADHKLLLFNQESETYYTNKPIDAGIGLGIFGFVIKFSFSIPPKSDDEGFSLDFKIDRYGTRSYNYAYVIYSKEFKNDGVYNNNDLRLLNIGLTHEFIFNKYHSLKSVYTLDRKQSMSNGSLLVGGGLFYTYVNPKDTLNTVGKQHYLYFGPNAGYSYTWIIKNDFFFNALSVIGTNLMFSFSSPYVNIGLNALPKLSFGYHGNKFSWNIYLTGSYLFAYPGTDKQLNLFSGNVGTAFIYRFK